MYSHSSNASREADGTVYSRPMHNSVGLGTFPLAGVFFNKMREFRGLNEKFY